MNDKLAFFIGGLVLANIGTIVSVLIASLKLAARFGELTATVKETVKDVDQAHAKIRDIEKHLISQ